HEAVLNSVVHHFDKVTGTIRPAVKITLLSGTADLFAPRRARNVFADSGSQAGENRIEVLDYGVLAPNHHTVAALQTPDPATCAHIHIVDTLQGEFPRAPEIVNVVGVATVDEDIVAFEQGEEISDRFVDHGCGNHQPH